MKNLIILLLMAIAIPSFGQTKAVKKFYKKYKNTENVTNVNIEGWILKMVATFADDEDLPKDIIRKISHLRILVFEEGNPVSRYEYNQLISEVKSDDFETLLTVRDGKDNVELMIRENAESITDALLFVRSTDEFVLLSLEGAFSLNDLKNLNLDIDEADHFEHIKGEL